MAILNFTIDNTEEAAKDFSGEFQVATPGWKTGVIINAEVKPTKKGGQMLVLENEIQGGAEHGIRVIDRLNIVNQSKIAQQIGRAALAKIALCVGHRGMLNNTNILIGRPYQFKVKIEEFKSNKAQPDGSYPMLKSNKITDYRSMADKPVVQKITAESKPTATATGTDAWT